MVTPEQFYSRRYRLALTLVELAQQFGVSVSTVNKWELGQSRIPKYIDLAWDALELKFAQRGWPLYDDPADYLLVRVMNTEDFYLFPRDRLLPKGVRKVEMVYDDDDKLFPEYHGRFPVLLTLGYTMRHRVLEVESVKASNSPLLDSARSVT